MTSPDADSGPGSSLRAYLELVRLPNVFTALADVMMGFLVTHPLDSVSAESRLLGMLLLTSALLYSAGMVFNDVFDFKTDTQERPFRPLPSGRISLAGARMLAWQLLILGVVCACLVAFRAGQWRPAIVGLVLAGNILLYDGLLKSTVLGPVVMGGCRLLNVLLGMSLLEAPWRVEHWLLAVAVGVYISGVTWFARREAGRSPRWHLGAAATVMLAGVGILAFLPAYATELIARLRESPHMWGLLMVCFALVISGRTLMAIADPIPQRVQLAVKQSLLSLVILDASVTFAVRDMPGALLVLLLLIPATVLGNWLYST